jgi:hypothetical protein
MELKRLSAIRCCTHVRCRNFRSHDLIVSGALTPLRDVRQVRGVLLVGGTMQTTELCGNAPLRLTVGQLPALEPLTGGDAQIQPRGSSPASWQLGRTARQGTSTPSRSSHVWQVGVDSRHQDFVVSTVYTMVERLANAIGRVVKLA